MRKKTLTRDRVIGNGWVKLEVITADMLKGYTAIGIRAFEDCAVKEITLPETIKAIHCYAFRLTKLKKVVLPETITDIWWRAFNSCKELEEVIFKGEKIEMLGYKCFAYCNNLKKINIPKNCSKIEDELFKGSPIITSKFEIQDYSKPVVAYKGFHKNMTCRGFQYKEGETYEFEGEPKLCECGFHACLNPLDVFNYYPVFDTGCVYHEVILESVSKERQRDTKVVGKKITIGRELTKEEMIEIFNKKVNGEN
jgi:hypothetical protein